MAATVKTNRDVLAEVFEAKTIEQKPANHPPKQFQVPDVRRKPKMKRQRVLREETPEEPVKPVEQETIHTEDTENIFRVDRGPKRRRVPLADITHFILEQDRRREKLRKCEESLDFFARETNSGIRIAKETDLVLGSKTVTVGNKTNISE